VLAGFKQRYRRSGFLVDTRGELPDHLPLVLEYAAVGDPVDGTALLQEYRASLELLRLGLTEDGSSYADVVAAVCATLPGVSPPDRAAVMAMAAAGPPVETVGLEPFDPRLLPVVEEQRR
jgi:nitrate reductase delta subunit